MQQYLDLLHHILKNGVQKPNRTGIDTISVFGYQTRYDLSNSFPLLTTKKMFYKGIFHELLWFVRGDSNIKYLVDNNVRIWNLNAYDWFKKSKRFDHSSLEEYITRIKNDVSYAKENGDIGPVYGRQWRNFGGVDQLQWLVDEIKKNPSSRRLIITAWNPTEIEQMALPPCLPLFQFMIDEKNQTISCHLYQRSADAFLGVPFDIASYSLLTCMIGKLTGYRPKELIHSFGDLHIYINHLEQVKIQLGRKVLTPPKLIIKRIPNSIGEFVYDDFEIKDYACAEPIKGEMAV